MRSRHRIPLKRTRRKAVIWLCVTIILAAALCIILLAPKEETLVIRSEKFILPDVTPLPPIEETKEAEEETTVRYDVPLDNDLQDYVTELCGQYGVDPALVYGIISVESDFDKDLVGDNGNSWGLMQIYATQHTARCVRLGAWNLLDPRQNIKVGVDFIAELMATGHDEAWVLSWYNGHGGDKCEYSRLVLAEAERIKATAG